MCGNNGEFDYLACSCALGPPCTSLMAVTVVKMSAISEHNSRRQVAQRRAARSPIEHLSSQALLARDAECAAATIMTQRMSSTKLLFTAHVPQHLRPFSCTKSLNRDIPGINGERSRSLAIDSD